MPHTRADVIRTRNELLRLLGEQRDIYADAISNLDRAKQTLLIVGIDNGLHEEVVELTDVAPHHNIIDKLAGKIAKGG